MLEFMESRMGTGCGLPERIFQKAGFSSSANVDVYVDKTSSMICIVPTQSSPYTPLRANLKPSRSDLKLCRVKDKYRELMQLCRMSQTTCDFLEFLQDHFEGSCIEDIECTEFENNTDVPSF